MIATLALLDRARSKVPIDALPELVMSDPGFWDYIAVYTAIIQDRAILDTSNENGFPFLNSFDVTECLLLSHNQAHQSEIHRWFSILTSCLELLGAGETPDISPSTSLSRLDRDIKAVGSADDLAALRTVVKEVSGD